MLMITHDLGVVANVAEDVVVTCHGEIMEQGGLEDIFNDPRFDMKPGERLIPLREIKQDRSALKRPERAP